MKNAHFDHPSRKNPSLNDEDYDPSSHGKKSKSRDKVSELIPFEKTLNRPLGAMKGLPTIHSGQVLATSSPYMNRGVSPGSSNEADSPGIPEVVVASPVIPDAKFISKAFSGLDSATSIGLGNLGRSSSTHDRLDLAPMSFPFFEFDDERPIFLSPIVENTKGECQYFKIIVLYIVKY